MRRTRRLPAVLALLLAVVPVLVACSSGDGPDGTGSGSPTASGTSSTPSGPVGLTFGVYGNPTELAAYRQVVATWNQAHPDVTVTLAEIGTSAADLGDLGSSDTVPDVFLVNRRDLGLVLQDQLTQPVGELLDQPGRDVDFGDGFVIDAVRAFAGDNDLQCMPYGYSPMVIYRNTDLVNFREMRRAGYDVPNPGGRWSFEQFTEAAQWASRPGTGAAGVYVSPTLRGLAPFIYSGGGRIFDDDRTPTSLDFSDGGTQSALETTLTLLRDPLVTLSGVELARQTPLEWFKDGKLGMIAGFRSLTPQLRGTRGVRWDVMPMPVLDSNKTVGDVTGLCLSKSTPHLEQAADFLYYASGADAVRIVARTGYLDPANLAVAASPDFLQPGRRPHSNQVWAYTARDIVLPPVLDTYDALEAAVTDDLERLFDVAVPGPDFLATLGAQIDADSQPVLNPPTASAGPSPTESG